MTKDLFEVGGTLRRITFVLLTTHLARKIISTMSSAIVQKLYKPSPEISGELHLKSPRE